MDYRARSPGVITTEPGLPLSWHFSLATGSHHILQLRVTTQAADRSCDAELAALLGNANLRSETAVLMGV